MIKEKRKAVDSILKKINKKYGTNVVSIASEVEESLRIKKLQTPSFEFNAMLDGGIAIGKIIELFGPNSSGKTSMALEIIGKAMREDPEFMVAWLETERSLDEKHLAAFGIDLDRFVLLNQTEEFACEDAMDALRGLASSGQFNMIVMNSVAGLLPSKEVSDEFDKQNIALIARNLSKFFRVITASLDSNETTLILINQLRQNLGAYIVCNTTTGGMSIPFYASQRIEMKKKRIEAGDPIKEEDGIKVECKVHKNRYTHKNPYRTCKYFALYGKGIDGVSELPSVLVREGILRKAGAWLRLENAEGDLLKVPTADGEVEGKWNGIAKFADFLRDDAIALEYFKDILSNKMNSGSVGVSLSQEEIAEIEETDKSLEEQMQGISEE